jgi:purine-binding chemotaxis protein CheW
MSELHVLFRVGETDYVLPAADVLQMESFTGATEVPGCAAHVAGLVQIRGRVIPVIDLRARFGLPPAEHTIDSRVIVVADGQRHVGLLADSARQVLRIEAEAFQPPPALISEQSRGFVSSIARVGPGVVMRIDFAKVIGPLGVPEEQSHGQQA